MRRLRQMQQTRGRPGGMGGGGPQLPKGAGGLIAGGIVVLGGVYVLSNSLFNVDGGHRAIKYRRISGVSKEIYNEGEFCRALGAAGLCAMLTGWDYRNAHQHSLVRNADCVRRASEAA